jgi:hypothetical protein
VFHSARGLVDEPDLSRAPYAPQTLSISLFRHI